MIGKKLGNIYIAKLSKGEKLVETLTEFAQSEKIRFAWINGLGAFSDVSVGYYNLDEKEYHFQEFQGDLEVTSLIGNISTMEEKPLIHLHVTIADDKQSSFGGHLKEAVVGGTIELRIETFEEEIRRMKDEETGLNLLDL